MKFKKGDMAVYPGHGVGAIKKIEKRVFFGKEGRILRPENLRHGDDYSHPGKKCSARWFEKGYQHQRGRGDIPNSQEEKSKQQQPALEQKISPLHGKIEKRIVARYRRSVEEPVPPKER